MDIDPGTPSSIKKVGILLLAHSGVANPEVWEHWSSLAPSGSIKFYVFCNDPEQLEYRNQFTLQNDLKIRMPTEWGSLSFVDAVIKSIETILSLRDGIETLHLVSGYDIPIKKPIELFRDKVIRFSNGYNCLRRADQSAMRALSFGFEGKFLKGVKIDGRTAVILRNHFVEHSSWLSLSRAHCMILVNATRTLKFLRPIATALREANECYPDEWLIGTILHWELQGPPNQLPSSIVDIENTAVIYPTQHGSAVLKAQRPIVWTSLNRCARMIKLCKRKRRLVLSDVLGFYMRTDSLFFRKIARIEELPEFYIRQLERYKDIDCHAPCDNDQKTVNPEEEIREEDGEASLHEVELSLYEDEEQLEEEQEEAVRKVARRELGFSPLENIRYSPLEDIGLEVTGKSEELTKNRDSEETCELME